MPSTKEKRRHDASLRIRLMNEHDQLIRRAATNAGISLSDWCRDRLIRAARQEIRGPSREKL